MRVQDNKKVVLKKVGTWTDEIPVISYLSSSEIQSYSRNRSVPLLDVIPLPGDDEHALIVMPLLYEFHEPPFARRGEVIEALRQIIQVRLFHPGQVKPLILLM